MASPKATTWEIEPHTLAKHEILKRYLQAWMPILAHGKFKQFIYIDGFAGPGIYSGGEEGSPVIAIKAALAHIKHLSGKIIFSFIEKDMERAESLEKVIDDIPPPKTFKIEVEKGKEFAPTLDKLISFYESKGKYLPPTFAFIDPFGWTGVPFESVKKVLSFQNCEVFVNFMYEEINRFLGHPDQEENFDIFFGTDEWREVLKIKEPRERNRFLHDLYIKQLKKHAKYVRSFEMKNDRGVTDYFLFYATNNLLGMKKMKESMWKIDEAGHFTFSDATDQNQMILFEKKPRVEELKKEILKRFSGRTVSILELENFIIAETAFRETHYKTQILKPMEISNPPEIEIVSPPQGRKRGTYASPDLKIKFF